jgi:hypothetical protein
VVGDSRGHHHFTQVEECRAVCCGSVERARATASPLIRRVLSVRSRGAGGWIEHDAVYLEPSQKLGASHRHTLIGLRENLALL